MLCLILHSRKNFQIINVHGKNKNNEVSRRNFEIFHIFKKIFIHYYLLEVFFVFEKFVYLAREIVSKLMIPKKTSNIRDLIA